MTSNPGNPVVTQKGAKGAESFKIFGDGRVPDLEDPTRGFSHESRESRVIVDYLHESTINHERTLARIDRRSRLMSRSTLIMGVFPGEDFGADERTGYWFR